MIICIIAVAGSSISTLAASTKDEFTSSPEQNQMRTESQRPPEAGPTTTSITLAMRFSPDRKDATDLEAISPLKHSPLPEAPPLRREDRGPPLSADLLTLGNRDRRSKSEERCVYFVDLKPLLGGRERGSDAQYICVHMNNVMHVHRVFTFDPAEVKKVSVSTDSLDKAMEDPIIPTASSIPAPSTSEVSVRRRRDRERRYSAPPSERRNTRDSVGSLDYLSESQGQLRVEFGCCLVTCCSVSCTYAHSGFR